jgi:dTDP-4-dehydrorhamnose reductase
MLGQMVKRHFETSKGFEVVTIEQRFSHQNLVNFFQQFDSAEPSIFINCIGAIPQRISHPGDFILPNILLPLELGRTLAHHHRLIHPSTDCVFRGDLQSPYRSDATPDASDTYGWTKLLAERALMARPNTLVIRTSIIGPNSGASAGLLQWFLSQPEGARVSGYTNHYWNGMTTLQWCLEVENLLSGSSELAGRILQFGWPEGCSKYEMLLQFRETFRRDIEVVPRKHHESVDRRLEADIAVPELRQQLERLRSHMDPIW